MIILKVFFAVVIIVLVVGGVFYLADVAMNSDQYNKDISDENEE